MAEALIQYTTSTALEITDPNSVNSISETCTTLVKDYLPDVFARFYFDNLFKKETIDDMKLLIKLIKDAYGQLIDENKWMDDITRENAKNKLKAIEEYIGLPEFVSNDQKLQTFTNEVINYNINCNA